MISSTLRTRLQRTRRNPADGFTLFEVIIAVAVIAILTAIGVPTYISQLSRARETTRNNSALSAGKACLIARINNTTATFAMPAGATGTCTATGAVTITSDVAGPGTEAEATIAADGSISLSVPATGS